MLFMTNIKAGLLIGTKVLLSVDAIEGVASHTEVTFLGFDAGDARIQFSDGKTKWVHPSRLFMK